MEISDHFNRVLIDKTLIGLALCKMDGTLVYVNQAYCDLIGQSIAQTLQLSYWQITPEKYQQQEADQLESLEKTGHYGPYEKEYIHADGHLVPVRLSGQIVELDGEEYIWSSVEDISDRVEAESRLRRLYQQMEKLSLEDELTGIANRRMFDITLENEWQRAQRDATPLSLIMLDIDYFKQYNDHFGHTEGDECLIQVAEALSASIKRSVDFVARYGGEEFVILLPETGHQQAIKIAEQCRAALCNKGIHHPTSQASDYVTVSAGVSTYPGPEINTPEALIKRADDYLYQAKDSGRNKVCYGAG